MVSAVDDSTTPETDVTIDGTISASVPSLVFTDTTVGHDDFELWADAGIFGLANTINGAQIFRTTAQNGFNTIGLLTTEGGATLNGAISAGAASSFLLPQGISIGPLSYTFPSARGANGTVLTENGSGGLSWVTGGGGNSFETIAVPAGTNPVADSSTDTLTFTETSPLVITGTAGTDTIDITWSSVDLGADGTIQANSVALTTDTTGNYAAGDAEAGNALTGDSATAFFSAGQIEAARGGTGQDFSGSTGSIRVSSGTFSANTETGTGNSVLATTPTVATPVFTTSAEISGTVPRSIWTDTTASEDDFEAVVDGSTFRVANTTDGVTSLIHYGNNEIGLGEVGFAPASIVFITDGTGDNEIRLPSDSVGIQELDAVDEPANNEVYSFDSATGRGQWDDAGAGGADSWDTITAAAASATTANGDNAIVYNTAQTTASRISWRFSESSAGISTGTPVLLQADTLADSTAIPLLVKSRASEVFRVSPTSAQLVLASGSAAAPTMSFIGDLDTGILRSGPNSLNFSVGGTQFVNLNLSGSNAGATFAQTGTSPGTIGVVGIIHADTPSLTSATLGMQATNAGAGPATLSARYSRGTAPNTPTVITTGDDLFQISSSGYVGGTNTYVEAARILFDSTGTIADTASGVGGIMRFSTRAVGDASLTEVFNIQGGATPQILANVGTAANPTYSFLGNVGTGVFRTGGLNASLASGLAFSTATVPIFSFDSAGNIYLVRSNDSGADAVSIDLRGLKSRGTTASPTVLTTGDDLLKVGGHGYVGATGQYVEAANILFDSTGTIADTTTGVGGIISLQNRIVGGAMTERLNITGNDFNFIDGANLKLSGSVGTSATNTIAIKNGTAPSTSPTDVNQIYSGDAVAGNSQLFTRNEAGTVERLTGLNSRVSTQFDKTDTTLANVTGLTFNLEASRAYSFNARLWCDADIVGGVKAAISGTCTATSIIYEILISDDTTNTFAAIERETALGGSATAANATSYFIEIKGTIVVNAAGTLTTQFAQFSATGTSSVLVNSTFSIAQIG